MAPLLALILLLAMVAGIVPMFPGVMVLSLATTLGISMSATLSVRGSTARELDPVRDDPKTQEREDVLDRAKREYVEASEDTLIEERIAVLEKAVAAALKGVDPFPPKKEPPREVAPAAKVLTSAMQTQTGPHLIPQAMSGPLASRPLASSVADGSVWYAEDLENQAWVARGGAWVGVAKGATYGDFVWGDVLPAMQENYPAADLTPVMLSNGPLAGKVVTKGRFQQGIYREALPVAPGSSYVGESGEFPVLMAAGPKVVEYRLERSYDPTLAGWVGLECGT